MFTSIIGNCLLFLACLLYAALLNQLYFKTAPGGDYVVGYAWGLIFMEFGLLLLLSCTTAIIAYKTGFSWMQQTGGLRIILVLSGLLMPFICFAAASFFKDELSNVSLLVSVGIKIAIFISLPLLLIIAFLLLNQEAVSRLTQLLAKINWLLGIAGCILLFIQYNAEQLRNQQAVAESIRQDEANNHRRILDEIEKNDPINNMVFILVFTDANQDEDIRQKALAKISSNPQWQQQLIRILKGPYAAEAFTFLASNDVADPALFTTALNDGILQQAALIRSGIRRCSHPSHLYAAQFEWEVKRVILTVDKFSGNGFNYTAAMKALRAALDEPTAFPKPVYNCIAPLEAWIHQHAA